MEIINNNYQDEIFDIVDKEGRVIDKAPRSVCHNGSMLLHPVIHIHVLNQDKKLLLQKRSCFKDIQPGKWDTSVGGHISAGESVKDAMEREAVEELGISIDFDKIKSIGRYIFKSDIENEFVYSYLYFYEGKIKFSEKEIDEVKWFSLDEIEELILNGESTLNFEKEFELLKKALLIL